MEQNRLRDEISTLYEEAFELAKKLNKKSYEEEILFLKNKHRESLDDIQEACEASDEGVAQVAVLIPEYVSKKLSDLPSKRKREMQVLDHNLAMVSYFVPLLGEIQSIKTKELTEQIVAEWNRQFPEHKIGHSTMGSIQGGFRKGLCYVTTTVCEGLGKPDDCYELTLLRDYRDQYLLNSKDGEDIVKEYYNIAPTIVKRISRKQDAAAVYDELWQNYLSPCVKLIESNQKEECKSLYETMVHELEKKYLYS